MYQYRRSPPSEHEARLDACSGVERSRDFDGRRLVVGSTVYMFRLMLFRGATNCEPFPGWSPIVTALATNQSAHVRRSSDKQSPV